MFDSTINMQTGISREIYKMYQTRVSVMIIKRIPLSLVYGCTAPSIDIKLLRKLTQRHSNYAVVLPLEKIDAIC